MSEKNVSKNAPHTHTYTLKLHKEVSDTQFYTRTFKVGFCLARLQTLTGPTNSHNIIRASRGRIQVTKTNTMTHKGHFCFPTVVFLCSA